MGSRRHLCSRCRGKTSLTRLRACRGRCGPRLRWICRSSTVRPIRFAYLRRLVRDLRLLYIVSWNKVSITMTDPGWRRLMRFFQVVLSKSRRSAVTDERQSSRGPLAIRQPGPKRSSTTQRRQLSKSHRLRSLRIAPAHQPPYALASPNSRNLAHFLSSHHYLPLGPRLRRLHSRASRPGRYPRAHCGCSWWTTTCSRAS